MPNRIRVATTDDAATCLDIYAPYVTDGAISLEYEVPTVQQMTARIRNALLAHTWLVLERDDEVVGYAYGHTFSPRAGYAWTCETSIYLRQGLRRTGAGRALYAELLPRLTELGFRRAFAGITLPNDASLGLHRAFGFEPAGTYRRVGWKHGRWHDVAWLQRDLGDAGDAPPGALAGDSEEG